MPRVPLPTSFYTRGFSLIEILLAVSVFGLLVLGLVGGLIYGEQSTALSGERARAVMLCEEGLEVARNIRDAGFSNLTTDTPHGLAISGTQWIFSGTSDTTNNFSRSLTISDIDADRKQVVCNVTWSQTPSRSGLVSATTYLTNWKTITPVDTCDIYCQSEAYATGICRASAQVCMANSETHESGGDQYCTGGESADTCCCIL